MGEYTSSGEVQVAPADLFDYLADIEHLPSYVPGLTAAGEQEATRLTSPRQSDLLMTTGVARFPALCSGPCSPGQAG